MKVVELLLILQDARIGGAELSLIEAVAEALLSLGDLLGDLLLVFGHVVLDEHIGAITLLRVAVVDQWIIERIHVT